MIKKIDFVNDGMYVANSVYAKNVEDTARKEFGKELNGYERMIVLTNGTNIVIKFGNDFDILIYTKSSQLKTPELKK